MQNSSITSGPRYRLISQDRENVLAAFARDVKSGLSAAPKRLSCRYIYDKRGSELFEQICRQPEYYVTRAECEILQDRCASIAAMMPSGCMLVELGAGSAVKTRWLIDAMLSADGSLDYMPIDISHEALKQCSQDLLDRFANLNITALAAEYDHGLQYVADHREGPVCVTWLGSSIGNLKCEQAVRFLSRVRAMLKDDDRMLVGTDLRKDPATIERAYCDANGVSARFNANIFERINRQLGGHFDMTRFRYQARYDEVAGRVDMGQVCCAAHAVRIDDLDFTANFEADEFVHVESSRKFSHEEVDQMAARAGFRTRGRWVDKQNRFALSMLEPSAGHDDGMHA